MMGETWAPMLLVAGSYLAMFGIGELLRRARLARAEVTRRSNHVGAGVIALALPLLFDSPWPVLALAVPFVAFLLATKLIGWLGSVHGISRRSAGAFLYPVSIAATFVIASDNYPHYAIAVLALALGDPAAGVAGERWKQHSYSAWGQVKTWEGSLAALTVTTALSSSVLVLSGVPPVGACVTGVFIGVVVALIEGALPWGLDNLGIPLATLASLSAAGSAASAVLTVLGAAALFGLALATPRLPGARRRGRPTQRTVASDAE